MVDTDALDVLVVHQCGGLPLKFLDIVFAEIALPSRQRCIDVF